MTETTAPQPPATAPAPHTYAAFLSASPLPRIRIVGEVLAERDRQVETLGHTSEQDDRYLHSELRRAAAAMTMKSVALSADRGGTRKGQFYATTATQLNPWPDSGLLNSQTCPRRAMIKAAALLVAAVEQIDRTAARSASTAVDAA